MKRYNESKNRATRLTQFIASGTALAAALAVSLPRPVHADDVTPPPVPPRIEVPAGSKAFLVGHAYGTQNYICLPSATSATGVAFTLFTPQATLFDGNLEQIITHFFSPNPAEKGSIRATWEDSRDTSAVWALATPDHIATETTDPAFVKPGTIAWLRLDVVGMLDGPTGGDRLTAAKFVQRVNTTGGVAPQTGCASMADLGSKRFVPYTADYVFFK